MENLFDPASSAKIIDRIGQLSADSKNAWGKMNVGQMLAHCNVPIGASLGDRKLKRTFIGFLFGKIAKKAFLTDKPFKKGLPTDASFIMTDSKNFEDEREKLIKNIHRFIVAQPEVFTNTHPFFGKMSYDEWGLLTWKHLDHHLQQFGV